MQVLFAEMPVKLKGGANFLEFEILFLKILAQFLARW